LQAYPSNTIEPIFQIVGLNRPVIKLILIGIQSKPLAIYRDDAMKAIAAAAIVLLGFACFFALTSAHAKSADPCQNKRSSVEERECYAREQARINAEADSLATKIAAAFRKDAQDHPDDGAVVQELTRKAASAVLQSQKSWRDYRDQYCRAVEFSYTTGSIAGTAYESCMFQLGQQRVHELRLDFNGYLPHD
jgi:uncharacterized protein YecT (DUF1311 family)